MTRILACFDGSVYSQSVRDHTVWLAKGLGASVEMLQVLGRREAVSEDRSGRIIAGARKQLLEQLASLDAERAKLLQEQARLELDEASAHLKEAGVDEVQVTLRQGDLLETLAELEASSDILVVGKRGEAADFATLHLGSNLERLLRAASIPVLVAARKFEPIERVLIAFDGRPSALKAVEQVSRSALFQGKSVTLVCAGATTSKLQIQLETALAQLRDAGIDANGRFEVGLAVSVIPKLVADENISLLVMGAYGHSRLRTLVIGSTTSEMIRSCKIPIMIYR